ncbi:hypothetical protein IAU59_007598 [Kwoniella sp. CBS 9459]
MSDPAAAYAVSSSLTNLNLDTHKGLRLTHQHLANMTAGYSTVRGEGAKSRPRKRPRRDSSPVTWSQPLFRSPPDCSAEDSEIEANLFTTDLLDHMLSTLEEIGGPGLDLARVLQRENSLIRQLNTLEEESWALKSELAKIRHDQAMTNVAIQKFIEEDIDHTLSVTTSETDEEEMHIDFGAEFDPPGFKADDAPMTGQSPPPFGVEVSGGIKPSEGAETATRQSPSGSNGNQDPDHASPQSSSSYDHGQKLSLLPPAVPWSESKIKELEAQFGDRSSWNDWEAVDKDEERRWRRTKGRGRRH